MNGNEEADIYRACGRKTLNILLTPRNRRTKRYAHEEQVRKNDTVQHKKPCHLAHLPYFDSFYSEYKPVAHPDRIIWCLRFDGNFENSSEHFRRSGCHEAKSFAILRHKLTQSSFGAFCIFKNCRKISTRT